MQPRTLVVFDFDRTVIHANSDTAIYAALNPEAQLPAEVAAKYVQGQWTRFMNDVMSHMAQQGITAQQLQQVLAEVQLTPGMQVRRAAAKGQGKGKGKGEGQLLQGMHRGLLEGCDWRQGHVA